ncbi:Amidophosphoribosyltransferase [Nymphon striatum]|nr:Amidophosphoribosyltransferase [Nymphon striatum]
MLVDDSIVRGTTSKEIVQMARDSGAKNVYFASASPAIRYPNIYGIDMPAAKELIAHGRTESEVANEIGADRLIYQELDDLIDAITKGNPNLKKFDCSVFTGEYITGESDSYFTDLEERRKDSKKKVKEDMVAIDIAYIYSLKIKLPVVIQSLQQKAGLGNLSGSFKTPLGVHKIEEKIGKGAKPGTIFKARLNTHAIAPILFNPDETSNADNITSRILWLKGLEHGVNLGNDVDTYKRYIYIHGTDEEGRLGTPVSHGCIRMANSEVIELFDEVEVGTIVCIIKESINNR